MRTKENYTPNDYEFKIDLIVWKYKKISINISIPVSLK